MLSPNFLKKLQLLANLELLFDCGGGLDPFLDMLSWKGQNVSYVELVVSNSDVLGCTVFALFFSLLSKLVSEHAQRSVTNLESRLKTLQKKKFTSDLPITIM